MSSSTSTAGVVQFLFDLQIDAKTSKKAIKNVVEALDAAGKSLDKVKNKSKGFSSALGGGLKGMGASLSKLGGSLKKLLGKFAPLIAFFTTIMKAAWDAGKSIFDMGKTIDITGDKFNRISKVRSGLLADSSVKDTDGNMKKVRGILSSYNGDGLVDGVIESVNRWGTKSNKAMRDAAIGATKLAWDTNLAADEAAGLLHTYVDLQHVWKSHEAAGASLSATMGDVSRRYNISSGEMVSSLQTVSITLSGLSAQAKKSAIPKFLDTVGAMNAIGISAQETAGMLVEIGEVTSETGNKMRSSIMAFSKTKVNWNEAFGNPAEHSKEIMTGMWEAIHSSETQARMKVSKRAVAESFGVSEDFLAKMNDADLNTALAFSKSESDKKAKREARLKQWEDSRYGLLDSLKSNLKVLNESLGGSMMTALTKLLGVLNNIAKFFTAIAKFFWVGLTIVSLIGGVLAFLAGGWIPALIVGIGTFLMGALGKLLPKWMRKDKDKEDKKEKEKSEKKAIAQNIVVGDYMKTHPEQGYGYNAQKRMGAKSPETYDTPTSTTTAPITVDSGSSGEASVGQLVKLNASMDRLNRNLEKPAVVKN